LGNIRPRNAFRPIARERKYLMDYKTKYFLQNFYIMGYNLKNARNGKSASKWPKFGAPGIKDVRVSLYNSLNFWKIWRICMENVAGEQGLAFQQLFPYKSSYSFKNSDCHKFSFFNVWGLKLGYFHRYFQHVFFIFGVC